MPHDTAVILVVGLTRKLIGPRSPRLQSLVNDGVVRTLRPTLPAVTCSVQSSMLTGLSPGSRTPKGIIAGGPTSGGPTSGGLTSGGGHGIVANGWYNRELSEIQFWKQSNPLVAGEKVWETARKRDPSVTCANLFWWFNMYSSADFSVTPRPIYKADGRKIPNVYTEPADLGDQLQSELGQFPLFQFWGPGASIRSTQWIADAAIRTHQRHRPTLTLVYLPHLDYDLQRYGPDDPRAHDAVAELDPIVGRLADHFRDHQTRVILLSEYAIEKVDQPVPINRILRREGAVRVRTEQALELLDPGASRAFAVADHQIAHLYIKNPNDLPHYQDLCQNIPGVEMALDRTAQAEFAINHPRGGDLVLVAAPGHWFCYDYWLDDSAAPDFARTVDIHRKPGYDPRELFIDPAITAPKLYIASKLLRKRLGQRTLMDVIPLDNTLVRGSHGRLPATGEDAPLLITERDYTDRPDTIPCTAIKDVILEHLFTD